MTVKMRFFALSVVLCGSLAFPAPDEAVVMRPKEGYCRYYLKRAANVLTNLSRYTSNEDEHLKTFLKAVSKNKISSSFIDVEIGRIIPIHPVNTPMSVEKAQQRIKDLKAHSKEIFETGLVDMSVQLDALSSKNAIRVIKFRDYYLITDGNGRLAALEGAFGDHPEIKVTVELIEIDNREDVEALIFPAMEGQGFDTSDLGRMRQTMMAP